MTADNKKEHPDAPDFLNGEYRRIKELAKDDARNSFEKLVEKEGTDFLVFGQGKQEELREEMEIKRERTAGQNLFNPKSNLQNLKYAEAFYNEFNRLYRERFGRRFDQPLSGQEVLGSDKVQ